MNVSDTLLSIEENLAEGRLESFQSAKAKADALLTELSLLEKSSDPDDLALAVSVRTASGHVERALGNCRESADQYEQAIATLQRCSREVITKREANLWTCHGLALLSAHSPKDWKSSILSFDEAITIRTNTRTSDETTGWGLSAGYLNKADALNKIGGEENLEEALNSLDLAIAILKDFNLETNQAFRSRLALAWMNKGNILGRLSLDYPHDYRSESLNAYQSAVEILRKGQVEENTESRRMLAVALCNCSRARAQLENDVDNEQIEVEARESLTLISEDELEDPEVAALMLTTRITLCFSLGEKRADEITDIVEDALHQIHPHTFTYQDPNDELLGHLFWCGANTYLNHYPQFLSEYLLEFLDPDTGNNHFAFSRSCQEAAVRVLWQAIATCKSSGFGTGDAIEKKLSRIGEWQECRERLAEIRNRFFTTEPKE